MALEGPVRGYMGPIFSRKGPQNSKNPRGLEFPVSRGLDRGTSIRLGARRGSKKARMSRYPKCASIGLVANTIAISTQL